MIDYNITILGVTVRTVEVFRERVICSNAQSPLFSVKHHDIPVMRFFVNISSNGLVWFYGISTILGYLMPNPFLYLYKYNFVYTQ